MKKQIEFLFDDPHLFAINKPAGIHSVALARSKGNSIAEILLMHSSTLGQVATKRLDAGLINRLDFETSGILLGAKNRACWDTFFGILQRGEIQKSYFVVIEGNLGASIAVENWIGSPNRHAKKMRVYRSKPAAKARALPAKSIITPVGYSKALDITFAKVECGSARRHQVRVHCAHLGHPLLGDHLYGAARGIEVLFSNSADRAFVLHAATASFLHPVTGERVQIEAPIDFPINEREFESLFMHAGHRQE